MQLDYARVSKGEEHERHSATAGAIGLITLEAEAGRKAECGKFACSV